MNELTVKLCKVEVDDMISGVSCVFLIVGVLMLKGTCFWLQMCLSDSGINYPSAEFEVTIKPTQASSSQPTGTSRTPLSTVEVQY